MDADPFFVDEGDIDAASAQLVQNQLIPAQQRHINLLDQLINSVGKA